MRSAAIAGGARAAELAARDDVRAAAEAGQHRQHGRVGIGLHREGDERRVAIMIEPCQRLAEHADMAADGRRRIDIDGRADRVGDRVQRHLLGMHGTVADFEMVHG